MKVMRPGAEASSFRVLSRHFLAPTLRVYTACPMHIGGVRSWDTEYPPLAPDHFERVVMFS